MARESQAFQREPLVSSEHEVVALVAHELRHPLTAIEAALPLMDAPQPETRQKARRVVERQVMYLRRTRGEMDAHAAARRRVLHRVVEHVRNDLLQTNRIALHDDGRRGRDLRHIDAALLRTRAKHADHVTNN